MPGIFALAVLVSWKLGSDMLVLEMLVPGVFVPKVLLFNVLSQEPLQTESGVILAGSRTNDYCSLLFMGLIFASRKGINY